MESMYLLVLLFTDILIDSMPRPFKETIHSVLVNHGESLILNCTCFNECNGQWSGPNTISVPNAGDFIPYTQGMDMNPRLNNSKYSVFGGYDSQTCNLQIMNFSSDDNGVYKCGYVHKSMVYLEVYILSAIRTRSFADMSTTIHVVMTSEPDIRTFANKDLRSNSVKCYGFVCMLIGTLAGGGLIFSICFNIYCILKRKRNTEIDLEFPPEVQYYEIGSIHDNIASIQGVPINVQEAISSVERPVSQRTNSTISSFENARSLQSYVQSILNTLPNEQVYENPYQIIDPKNIETHLYSILRSNMYQNTIIFPNEITNKNAQQERDPWLIIYKNTFVNDLK